MNKYPNRGGDCEYTMDCMWGMDGWCDRPAGNKCEIQKMDEARAAKATDGIHREQLEKLGILDKEGDADGKK